MSRIVVERSFDVPAEAEQLPSLEEAAAESLRVNKVTFLYRYLSIDRTRMVCFYEAPDADAVQRTQEEGGLRFDRLYAVEVLEKD